MKNDKKESYFNLALLLYLEKYGCLADAEEYARVNAVQYGTEVMGYSKGKSSLWWAFSWSDTKEGYAFWANHHNRFLIEQRTN